MWRRAGWLAFIATACGVGPRGSNDVDYAQLRARMVREQIEARGVADERVLTALREVPRHEFVPAKARRAAYEDRPLSIGEGQTISQPYIVAVMSEALALSGDERVLEVGTGSGYQAAVLSELAREVYTIEIEPTLAARAAADLARLGYRNVKTRTGDGYLGWPEAAPFDAIIVTAAPPEVPPPLIDQLAPGGRLVIPVGGLWSQELQLLEKTEGGVVRRELMPVRFVPLRHDRSDR